MTETQTKNEPLEVVGTRAPLAKVVPIDEARIDLFNPLKWSREDVELIKQTVCPKGIPDADFKLFIAKCQASGMNPLLGEAFCVDRNQNIGTKDSPKWIKVYVFTPGEQGMEARADDFPDFRGLRAAAVYEKDAIVIDPSTGEVSHQYNPVGDRGKLLGAWAIAYREGRKTPVEYVRFDEYYDGRNPQWASRPATMVVKCARAAALRRAYPNRFDGIYAREELRDDGGESEPTPAQAAQANRDTTDKLADRMKATAAHASRPGAESVPPGQRTVDVVVEKPKASPPKQSAKEAQLNAEADAQSRIASDPASIANEPSAQDVAALAVKLKAAGAPFDEAKLTSRVYFDEQVSKIAQFAKLATGTVSASDVERAAKAGAAPVGPLMVFGPTEVKGQPIASLSGPQLHEMKILGETKITSLTPDKAAKVRTCIDAIIAEQKKREAALLDEPPEPGSDLNVD